MTMQPLDFDTLIGNDTLKAYFKRLIEKERVGHAFLFSGPEGIGKSLFAQVLAEKMMMQGESKRKSSFPDIHHYRPEGKLGLHSIQSLRSFGAEVYQPPYESKWKVFIIHEADRMLSYSANALLKSFEEPPPQTLIILLSSAPNALLPTILSRCCHIHFHALSQKQIEAALQEKYQLGPEEASRIASLAQGSLGRACRLVEQKGDPIRELLLEKLSQFENYGYKELLQMIKAIAEQIENSKKQVEELLKEELFSMPKENLTAIQLENLEKELEGALSLRTVAEMDAIFHHILSWYRDLHLLKLNGSEAYLMNKDYASKLLHQLQKREVLPLEKVQKWIEEARLSLQRSTPINLCLENLFLKMA